MTEQISIVPSPPHGMQLLQGVIRDAAIAHNLVAEGIPMPGPTA